MEHCDSDWIEGFKRYSIEYIAQYPKHHLCCPRRSVFLTHSNAAKFCKVMSSFLFKGYIAREQFFKRRITLSTGKSLCCCWWWWCRQHQFCGLSDGKSSTLRPVSYTKTSQRGRGKDYFRVAFCLCFKTRLDAIYFKGKFLPADLNAIELSKPCFDMTILQWFETTNKKQKYGLEMVPEI